MKKVYSLGAALVMMPLLSGCAFAAEPASNVASQTSAQTPLDHDASKISQVGRLAFQDISLARAAIFDAEPTQAKAFIAKAKMEMAKVQTDDAVFREAESSLKTGAELKTDGKTPLAASKPASTDAIAWIPVDGELVLGEDFLATPEKAAAVADADKRFAKGDKAGALEKLKLAGINVNFVLSVLPLDKTSAEVDQASSLIGEGKYYEANSVLKQVDDGMRFVVFNDGTVVPQKSGTVAPAAKPATE